MSAVAEKPSLTIVRKYKASPEKVWEALTRPEAIKQWMGMHKTPVAETDVRVGGRYHVVMETPAGEQHDLSGTYREVVPNRKLVYTWAWKTMPERESLVTIELRGAGGGTEMTVRHEQFFDEEARKLHEQGWNVGLERMEAYLAR